jgi:hypothetical protein
MLLSDGSRLIFFIFMRVDKEIYQSDGGGVWRPRCVEFILGSVGTGNRAIVRDRRMVYCYRGLVCVRNC